MVRTRIEQERGRRSGSRPVTVAKGSGRLAGGAVGMTPFHSKPRCRRGQQMPPPHQVPHLLLAALVLHGDGGWVGEQRGLASADHLWQRREGRCMDGCVRVLLGLCRPPCARECKRCAACLCLSQTSMFWGGQRGSPPNPSPICAWSMQLAVSHPRRPGTGPHSMLPPLLSTPNTASPKPTLKSAGARRLASTPMMAVGCSARDRLYASGCQYQYCRNRARPTTAVRRYGPVRDCRPRVALRPPASRMPAAMMAPMRTMICREGVKG